jgi:hypothetical protein
MAIIEGYSMYPSDGERSSGQVSGAQGLAERTFGPCCGNSLPRCMPFD